MVFVSTSDNDSSGTNDWRVAESFETMRRRRREASEEDEARRRREAPASRAVHDGFEMCFLLEIEFVFAFEPQNQLLKNI